MLDATSYSLTRPCWKHEGIWGDKRCEQLVRYTHCRNCHVFGEAAAELLERPLPPEYREEWAERLAQPALRRRVEGEESAVIFRLGDEWLGLRTTLFLEVVGRRPVHTLPHREGGILEGVVNIRGELLVCISLARLFGIGGASPGVGGARRLLVVSNGGGRLVFPADEVYAGCRYVPGEVGAIPATLALAAAPFTMGMIVWNGRSVGLLDERALFKTIEEQLA